MQTVTEGYGRMKNYIFRFKHSIGSKFVAAVAALLSILILISYGFSAWYMIHSVQEKILEDYEGVISFTAKQMERYENDLRQYAILIAADKDLQKELTEKEISQSQSVKRSKNIYTILREYELLRSECVCIEIVLWNGSVFTSDASNLNSLHSIGDDSWFRQIMDQKQNRSFSEAHELLARNVYYDNIITYACDFGNYYTNQESVGMILLHIEQESFEDLVYESNYEFSWCAILNGNDEILAESGEKTPEIIEYMEEVIEKKDGGIKRIISGREGYFLTGQLDNGLQLIMFMPNSRLHKEEKNIFLFFMLLFLISLPLSILAVIFFSRQLINPIKALSNAARKISEGHLDVHLQSENADEIGTLTEIFNSMAVSLERQMKDLKAAERERADLQMSILMAQINPHFIYNTLNSAIYLSKAGEAQKAERLLQLFIQLLQNNMKSGIDGIITTLGEEIRDIKIYVELQKIRYPGRFEMIIRADEKLYSHAMPRLILQPLIENALNHGVLSKEFGVIELTVFEKDNYLNFVLEDDGEGMDADRVKEILKRKDKRKHSSKIHSISIENICHRLSLFYKDTYYFEVKSEPDKGTAVAVGFPLEYTEAGEKGDGKNEKLQEG